MSEVGVNPNGAVSAGGEAGTIAMSFRGITTMFQSAVDVAYLRAAESPIQSGYAEYGTDNVSKMARVQAHGEALSGNVEAGGADAARTDRAVDDDFAGVADLLRRDLDHQVPRG
ncbi:hypothetical protein [Actinomadura sp. 21ATH]|uniref:hypothetical protein n=1 Tax=Actinomadura sp. 21ATH TaxID=1735444 RepID=UPI0035C04118